MNVGALKTAGGYRMDEVASALQKCIRRGLEKEACFWAQELESAFPNYLWRRLLVIAHEDVGVTSIQTIQFVEMCRQHYYWFQDQRAYEFYPVVNAVLAMCRAEKTRAADHIGTLVYQDEAYQPEVPDFALDEHTQRGKQMGRGMEFWIAEAQRLDKPDPSPYQEEVDRLVLKYGNRYKAWVEEKTRKVRGGTRKRGTGPNTERMF